MSRANPDLGFFKKRRKTPTTIEGKLIEIVVETFDLLNRIPPLCEQSIPDPGESFRARDLALDLV